MILWIGTAGGFEIVHSALAAESAMALSLQNDSFSFQNPVDVVQVVVVKSKSSLYYFIKNYAQS